MADVDEWGERSSERTSSGPGRAKSFARALRDAALVTSLPLLVFAADALAARPSSIPPSNQPVVGPQGTLEAVARGYRDRSVDSVVANYTADYRFHTVGDSLLRYTWGNDREYEVQSLRNMFEGKPRAGKARTEPSDSFGGAPVDSIGVIMDGFQDGVDPEHPDSSQHYQVVVVGRFEMGFRVGDTRVTTRPSKHVFHMVRGDVAVLSAGQPAAPDRWYVRRWLEDVSGVLEALSQRQGDCGEAAAPSAGPRSSGVGSEGIVSLAIRPLTNPACARLQVTCELPAGGGARVEVYDVSGRRVNRRDVKADAAGSVIVDAGAGAKLAPGAYWVRLTQGAVPPATRMVMVAR